MPNKPPLRFQRANYVVSDIQRSLTLYRDVLGFEVAFEKGHNPNSYSIIVQEIPPEGRIAFCVLSAPGQPRVMALTEISGVELPKIPYPRRGAIVLEISDLDAVIEGAQKLGLHTYEEGNLVTGDGRTGREFGIVDFDGNLIVIYLITGGD